MPGRVLIADGDPSVRQRVFTALLEVDVFVDPVASTTEAVSRLSGASYEVVLLDVALPPGRSIPHFPPPDPGRTG